VQRPVVLPDAPYDAVHFDPEQQPLLHVALLLYPALRHCVTVEHATPSVPHDPEQQ
jgi:hypothetical protein